MKKSKALVFPSLLYEGAPLTIFEAQSLGLPVIVSKYSNGKDFVWIIQRIIFISTNDRYRFI